MTLFKYTDEDVPTGTETMYNPNDILTLNGLHTIRSIGDRSIPYSKGYNDFWGDYYSDTSGQMNTVSTTSSITTAFFDTSKFVYFDWGSDNLSSYTSIGSAFLHTTTLVNSTYMFDCNVATSSYATYNGVSTTDVGIIGGKTFSERFVKSIYYSFYILTDNDRSSANTYAQVYVQTYDGATWTTVGTLEKSKYTLINGVTYSGFYSIGASCQGVRLYIEAGGYSSPGTNTTTVAIKEFHVFDETVDPIIYHTIPTGTFSSNISSAIGVPLIYEYSSTEGNNIVYKLANSTEDSGWLPMNQVSTFTAFTSEPTKLYIKLLSAKEYEPYTNPITNYLIESDITGNWTYGEYLDTGACYAGYGRTTDGSIEGTYGLEIRKIDNTQTGDEWVYYEQTGVDLSRTGYISLLAQATYAINIRIQLYDPDTSTEYNLFSGEAATNKRSVPRLTSGLIPEAYRKSNMTVRIGTYGFVSDNGFYLYMDSIICYEYLPNLPTIKGFVVRAT